MAHFEKEVNMIQNMTCRMMAEKDINLVVPLYIEHYNTYEGGAWTQDTTYKRIHQYGTGRIRCA